MSASDDRHESVVKFNVANARYSGPRDNAKHFMVGDVVFQIAQSKSNPIDISGHDWIVDELLPNGDLALVAPERSDERVVIDARCVAARPAKVFKRGDTIMMFDPTIDDVLHGSVVECDRLTCIFRARNGALYDAYTVDVVPDMLQMVVDGVAARKEGR